MACGAVSRRYAEFTVPLMQEYAQKCDADFHCVYQKKLLPGNLSIGYQKFLYSGFFDIGYSRILHIDADAVVKANCPNLFDVVPADTFAAVNELPYQCLETECPPIGRLEDIEQNFTHLYRALHGFTSPFCSGCYFNAGIMLLAKRHARHLSLPEHCPFFFKEQALLNCIISSHKEEILLLPPKFNFMKLMEDGGLNKSEAHIIHYAGSWGGLSADQVLEMMKKDYAST